MKHSLFRCALMLALTATASAALAQAPEASADSKDSAQPDKAETKTRRRPRNEVTPLQAASRFASPHGPRSQGARVIPASDIGKGEIQVVVTSGDFETLGALEGAEVRLVVTKHSIERGNTETVLTAPLDGRGRASFPSQPTETDYVYKVSLNVGAATFSTQQFQFRATDMGLRVLLPVVPITDTLDGLLLLSRAIVAFIPQDDLFAVDVIWRVENYSEKAWVPKNVSLPLPEGFRALNIRASQSDARFEPDADRGVKFAGTFAPGQHDLMFRFHLPTHGRSSRTLQIPTAAHLGSMRVVLDGSPSMNLEVEGFGEPDATRNQDGQRRLVATRDFLKESTRAPELIPMEITGIPTPPPGRMVAVSVAGALALAGLGQGLRGRKRNPRGAASLSKEDRQRASELLLEELISLERAFEQGTIGRKTHEAAKRQLLEAYARLGAHGEDAAPGAA